MPGRTDFAIATTYIAIGEAGEILGFATVAASEFDLTGSARPGSPMAMAGFSNANANVCPPIHFPFSGWRVLPSMSGFADVASPRPCFVPSLHWRTEWRATSALHSNTQGHAVAVDRQGTE
jgi:hypothetical protein